MAKIPSVASKIPGSVAGEIAKKSLTGLGSNILAGLGTGGSFNFGTADIGADDALESGKQTGPTGDKSKDVINALRDLQSDVNKQSAALKKNNGLLAKQNDLLAKGFESLIKVNEENLKLLSQMSGGGGFNTGIVKEIAEGVTGSVLTSLLSGSLGTTLAAAGPAAALGGATIYAKSKLEERKKDYAAKGDLRNLRQELETDVRSEQGYGYEGANIMSNDDVKREVDRRLEPYLKMNPNLKGGELEPGYSGASGQVLQNAIANPAGLSSAAPVATTASRIWTPKQVSSPSGYSSIGRTAGAPAGASGPVHGNASEAMQFFMSKGWTKEQAAGIVGNLKIESGNFAADVLSGARKGDGGKAVGVAQWHPDRQANFQKVFGKSLIGASFKEQLEFVNWELAHTEAKAGNILRSARTAQEAASIVDQFYERSSGAHRTQRMAAALQYAGATADQINTAASPSGSSDAMQVASAETGTSSGGGGDYSADGKGGGGGGGRSTSKAAASVPAALSTKESSTLKQAMAVTDPHVKSRAMFQAAQDAEARGENSTALFWAADKQRQAELASLSGQPKAVAKKQATKVETPSKAYYMSDPNQSAYSGDTGTWQKTDVTTNADAAAYSGDTGTWTSRPGAAAEAAQPAVGYDRPFPTTYQALQAERVRSNTELANDAIRVRMYDQDTEETYGANAIAERNKIAEDQAKRAAISSGAQTPVQVRGSMSQAAAAIQGTPADLGRQAIQKSQDTEPGYSGASGQVLQNAVSSPAESGEDKSQSSIKPEDSSIGAQEFNRLFGNFWNATAGW